MNNIQTLYQFELKKILSRKIVWITVAIMLVLMASAVYGQLIGDYYIDGKRVDSNYGIFEKTRVAQKALTGRAIDQQLLEETWDAYGKIPAVTTTHYTGTDEYWEYAFPYHAIFNFVQAYTDMTTTDALNWEADEADMYRMRQEMMENNLKYYYLNEGEKEYWRQQELSIQKPYEYAYKEGWWTLLDALYTIGLMTLLTIAICLSNVFTVEQTRKTDQLIFCSRYGKSTLYLAKMLAGISFAAGISLLYTAVTVVQTLAVYGSDGFFAAFQLIYPDYFARVSVGQAVLIGYVLLFIAAILSGVFTMVLSEILQNGIGTLATISGIIILSMFVRIPYHNRVLAQIWDYLPSVFLSIWSIFDCWLVPFAGTYLTNIQFVPILYIVIAGILSVIGFRIYQKYQVGAK